MKQRTGCPHKNIVHCPLYVAMHIAGFGCDDGRLNEGGCAVSRGASYEGLKFKLDLVRPDVSALCSFEEQTVPRTKVH